MGAKIEAFLDCVSPYSYYAFLYLLKNRAALSSHSVEVEFTPIFLGGVNVGSENTPPWKNPAKAKYSSYDGERARKYFGAHKLQTPSFFPILSLLPQRCMVYVKDRFPGDKYEASFLELWVAMWEQQLDISIVDNMVVVLSRHFAPEAVQEIIAGANTPVYKKKLLDNTQRVLGLGAFGAPWFWVRSPSGKEEPFFGSDRFHYMFEFLELPWVDMELKLKI